MKTELLFTLVPLALVAVLLQLMPLLTRRGIFFSATVDPEFPQSEDGRRLLRSFRMQAALWTLVAFALALVLTTSRPGLGASLPALVLVTGVGFSYWLKFREVHDRYGQRRPEVRETDLSLASPAKEPSLRLWLAVPPFVALAAVALYLNAHWSRIPAEFPVHWGVNMIPNRWASRSFGSVYGPLLMGAVMDVLLLAFGWALIRMSRKSVMLHVTMRVLEVLLYPLTFSFIVAALLPLVRLPMWLVPAVMLTFTAGIFVWAYRKITTASAKGETPEPQSDSYWKAGVFYFNPSDPAIFVSKRVGIGYTMNFANKVSWMVLAGFLMLVLLPAMLVRK